MDPCSLVLVAHNDEDSQTMWCHLDCLKERAVHAYWSPPFGGEDLDEEWVELTPEQIEERFGGGIPGVTTDEVEEFLRELDE